MNRLSLFTVDHDARPTDVHDEHRDVCRMMESDRASGGWLYAVTPRGLWVRGDIPRNGLAPGWCASSIPSVFVGPCALLDGNEHEFFAVINPVRSEFVAGRRGKRRHTDPHDWIASKLPKIGAEPISVSVTQSVAMGLRNGVRLTLSRAICTGTIRVKCARSLESAIDIGIGSAKGYGCGLLALGVSP